MSTVATAATYTMRLRTAPAINFPWVAQHMNAVNCPRNAAERSIVNAIESWLMYADFHSARYESGIGDDGVLGPAWAQWGASLRTLLNGDCGRLDCGTLDSLLCNTLTAEGFDPDML